MTKISVTFQFWNMIFKLEKLILIVIKAYRQNEFNLYVETLERVVGFLFSLNHYNYARWISIHIRDMKSLSKHIRDDFKKQWAVNKTKHRFSALSIDNVHEQLNAKVKGKGEIIGLTDKPYALQRWLISGPEMAHVVEEFELQYMSPEEDKSILHHHAEGHEEQNNYRQQVQKLVDVILDI